MSYHGLGFGVSLPSVDTSTLRATNTTPLWTGGAIPMTLPYIPPPQPDAPPPPGTGAPRPGTPEYEAMLAERARRFAQAEEEARQQRQREEEARREAALVRSEDPTVEQPADGGTPPTFDMSLLTPPEGRKIPWLWIGLGVAGLATVGYFVVRK